LVVPARYSPADAVKFASGLDAGMASIDKWIGPEAAIDGAMLRMADAFRPGGEQDLQRGGPWGVPPGETSPLFRDAASWHLGYVTQLAGLPATAVEKAAGMLRSLEHGGTPTRPVTRGFQPKDNTQQKPESLGPFGMDEENYKDFLRGMQDGKVSEAAGVLGQYGQLREDLANVGNTAVTTVGRLRSFAHDARAASRNKALPEAMRLHRQIQRLRRERRSFAPKRSGRDGSTESASPTFAMATFEPFLAIALARRVMGGEAVAGGRAGAAGVAPWAVLHKAAVGASEGLSLGMRLAGGAPAPVGQAAGADGAYAGLAGGWRGLGAGGIAAAARRVTGKGAGWRGGVGSAGAGGVPSVAPRRMAGAAAAGMRAARWAAGDAGGTVARTATQGPAPGRVVTRAPGGNGEVVASTGAEAVREGAARRREVEVAMRSYFEAQARLPPASGAAFDPTLSPAWAGMQIPV